MFAAMTQQVTVCIYIETRKATGINRLDSKNGEPVQRQRPSDEDIRHSSTSRGNCPPPHLKRRSQPIKRDKIKAVANASSEPFSKTF